jgi:sorting nexin-25
VLHLFITYIPIYHGHDSIRSLPQVVSFTVMPVKPLVRSRKMSTRAVKAGAPLAVLLVAILLPRLSLLQTILLTPAFVSLILVATIGIVLVYAVRREASHSSNELDRQRHALRRFIFTTPSAWSAVLTRQSWEDSPSPSWRTPIRQLSGATSTVRFNALFDLIKANFILPWYARISPSRAFPDAVEILIRQSLSRTIQRGEDIDWPDILVSRIVPLVTDHLHHFRSIEHLASTSARPTSQAHLPLPLPKNPHPALATTSHGHSTGPSPTIEAHLRGLVKRMLKHILPQHEQTEVVGTIASEVVLGTVLMPVFEMLCEGDFWNRQIDEHGGRYLHEQ